MTRYEIAVSKVVERVVDWYETEEQARAYAVARRDDHTSKDNKVEYFYELTEVSNV